MQRIMLSLFLKFWFLLFWIAASLILSFCLIIWIYLISLPLLLFLNLMILRVSLCHVILLRSILLNIFSVSSKLGCELMVLISSLLDLTCLRCLTCFSVPSLPLTAALTYTVLLSVTLISRGSMLFSVLLCRWYDKRIHSVLSISTLKYNSKSEESLQSKKGKRERGYRSPVTFFLTSLSLQAGSS